MVSVSSFGLRYLAMMAVPNPKESSLWGTCVYEAEAAFRSTEKLHLKRQMSVDRLVQP